MTELGYRIPKEIIELLIDKYAPTQMCCDFCYKTRAYNEVCPICCDQKIRCSSRCEKMTYDGYCFLCRKISHLTIPCRMCTVKYTDADIGVTGRRAIRHVDGKMVDKWFCTECLLINPCNECGCIKNCSDRCKTKTL